MASRQMKRLSPSQQGIIQKYTSTLPVRMGELAKELGISAIRISQMETGVSGQISKEGNGYVIRINRNEARDRQRFTIAHELAHYLLHRSLIDASDDGIKDNVLYRSGAPERVEFEANQLAGEIIVPATHLRAILSEEFRGIITDATIEILSNRFAVSKSAIRVSLERLAAT